MFFYWPEISVGSLVQHFGIRLGPASICGRQEETSGGSCGCLDVQTDVQTRVSSVWATLHLDVYDLWYLCRSIPSFCTQLSSSAVQFGSLPKSSGRLRNSLLMEENRLTRKILMWPSDPSCDHVFGRHGVGECDSLVLVTPPSRWGSPMICFESWSPTWSYLYHPLPTYGCHQFYYSVPCNLEGFWHLSRSGTLTCESRNGRWPKNQRLLKRPLEKLCKTSSKKYEHFQEICNLLGSLPDASRCSDDE